MRTMYTKERNMNSTVVIPIETELLSKRVIFIDSEIDADLASLFMKQIMQLILEDKEKPIKVIINSTGGSIDAGLLMYDIIQSSGAKIEMYCIGMAYRIAALLFLSGKHGRFLLEHSKLNLYEPLIKNNPGFNTSGISSSLQDIKTELDKIISIHSGNVLDTLSVNTSFDYSFSAEEAVLYGIADKIITADKLFELVH